MPTYSGSGTAGFSAGSSSSARRDPRSGSSSAGFRARSSASGVASGPNAASAAAGFSVGSLADATAVRVVSAAATSGFSVGASASSGASRATFGKALSGFVAGSSSSATSLRSASASSGFAAGSAATSNHSAVAQAAAGFSAGSSGSGSLGRAATATAGFSAGSAANVHAGPRRKSATAGFSAGSSSSGLRSGPRGLAGFAAGSFSSSTVVLASGITVPGGDLNAGPPAVLAKGVSGSRPFTFAETPTGDVLLANGIDPFLRWTPRSATLREAGMDPPASGPALGGTGAGRIVGRRVAFVRWIDDRGRPSNLSPASNVVDLGRDGAVESVQSSAADGSVVVVSRDHGLFGTVPLVFDGVDGVPGLSGVNTVVALDQDRLRVTSLVATSDTYAAGGSWTLGVDTVVYSSLPRPTDPKVSRRQILRNLHGTLDALYVDLDTPDLASASLSSSRTDEELAACESVAVTDADGLPAADRYAKPPAHKAAVCAHMGRVFAAGDTPYSEGCLKYTPGSAVVRGVGTDWRPCFAGRLLAIDGVGPVFTVLSVDRAAQTMTLDRPVPAKSVPYATYVVRAHPGDRNTVYYSEPGEPESWPAWNALTLPDDGDDIVGLFSNGSYLYVVEKARVYRVVFSGAAPAAGGSVFLASRRGSVNHRCVVQVEGHAFMLDELGVHDFQNDDTDDHLSSPVQPFFRGEPGECPAQIDWSADRSLWHGSHDPAYETVRWFVHVAGSDALDHALCYHYRLKLWWLERYPFPVTASCQATVGGQKRTLAGSDARRVLCLWSGTADALPPGSSPSLGPVSSATDTTLTDASASFPGSLASAVVTIASGTGAGQTRAVSSNTSTVLTLVKPWDTPPDATSVYVVGGVPWRWRSPWLRYAADETSNPRNVELHYRPTARPSTLTARLYQDQSPAPSPSGVTRSDDGVSAEAGSPDITVSLAAGRPRPGWSALRTEGHMAPYAYGPLFASVELEGVQGADPVRIWRLDVLGAAEQGGPNP